MVDIADIANRDALYKYLIEQNDSELSKVIALRSALRVLPFISTYDSDDSLQNTKVTLYSFQATLISWVVRNTRTHDIRVAAVAYATYATYAAYGTFSAAVYAAYYAADAAYEAADAARADAAGVASIAAAANAAASATANAADATADIWVQIQVDLQTYNQAIETVDLISAPLWQDETKDILRDNNLADGSATSIIPNRIMAQIAHFEGFLNSLSASDDNHTPWNIWMDWYNAMLDPGKKKLRYFTPENALLLAQKDKDLWGFDNDKNGDERWVRDPNEVMADIAELVGWKAGDAEPPEDRPLAPSFELVDANTPLRSINEPYNGDIDLEDVQDDLLDQVNDLIDDVRRQSNQTLDNKLVKVLERYRNKIDQPFERIKVEGMVAQGFALRQIIEANDVAKATERDAEVLTIGVDTSLKSILAGHAVFVTNDARAKEIDQQMWQSIKGADQVSNSDVEKFKELASEFLDKIKEKPNAVDPADIETLEALIGASGSGTPAEQASANAAGDYIHNMITAIANRLWKGSKFAREKTGDAILNHEIIAVLTGGTPLITGLLATIQNQHPYWFDQLLWFILSCLRSM